MIKTFKEAVKFLEKYVPTPDKKHPGELGIKRMRYLCDLLGNPQFKFPTIHVGGTSGKGSTSTIISTILATKYKAGLHTSPHLEKINERIKILNPNNKIQISNQIPASPAGRQNSKSKGDITNKEFILLINKVTPAIKKMETEELGPPSYFEIVTAMAFLYFQKQKVDFAVIEVGMGGRFDATNVVKPEAAVLTNVGLDHTEILGDTVEKIAEDKVGIIKSEIEVISGVKQPSVIQILKSKIKNQRSKLSLLNIDFRYEIKSVSEKGSVFDYFGEKTIRDLKISLLGEHQIENAALAIRTIEQLSESMSLRGAERRSNPSIIMGSPRSLRSLPMTSIRTGLVNAYIPGRLEIIKRHPLVVIDGAHNTDKMRALVKSIKTIFPGKKVTGVIAIKEDKMAREMLEIFIPLCQKVIITGYEIKADQGIIKSYDPGSLLKIVKEIDKNKDTEIINKPGNALEIAVKKSKRDGLILITGSLYLVGEICKK